MTSKDSLSLINDVAVLKTEMQFVRDDVRKIDTKISEFISKVDEKYATKYEISVVNDKIEKMDNRTWGAIVGVISLLIGICGYFLTQYFR